MQLLQASGAVRRVKRLTSWKPLGLCRPLTGLLLSFTFNKWPVNTFRLQAETCGMLLAT